MSALNIILWIAGAVLLTVAVLRVRQPYGRMTELERLADNARRYEGWRGGRAGHDGGVTGADVMRQMLRRQVLLWAAVGVAGVVLLIAGFAVR
jgi:hypothetical protein